MTERSPKPICTVCRASVSGDPPPSTCGAERCVLEHARRLAGVLRQVELAAAVKARRARETTPEPDVNDDARSRRVEALRRERAEYQAQLDVRRRTSRKPRKRRDASVSEEAPAENAGWLGWVWRDDD